jgi:hypothetical protein
MHLKLCLLFDPEESISRPCFPLRIGHFHGRDRQHEESPANNMKSTPVATTEEHVELPVKQQAPILRNQSVRMNGTIQSQYITNTPKFKHYDLDTGNTYLSSNTSVHSATTEDNNNKNNNDIRLAKLLEGLQKQSRSQFSKVHTESSLNDMERPKDSQRLSNMSNISTSTSQRGNVTQRDVSINVSKAQYPYHQNEPASHEHEKNYGQLSTADKTFIGKREHSYDDIEKSRTTSFQNGEQILGLRLPSPSPTSSLPTTLPVSKHRKPQLGLRAISVKPLLTHPSSSPLRSELSTRSRHHAQFTPIDYSMIGSVITDSDDELFGDKLSNNSDNDSISLFGERSALLSLPSLDSR